VANIHHIVKELREERRLLDRAIAALEQVKKRRVKGTRKRAEVTPAERAERKDGTTGKVVPFVRRPLPAAIKPLP
jgi:hypothetical protein